MPRMTLGARPAGLAGLAGRAERASAVACRAVVPQVDVDEDVVADYMVGAANRDQLLQLDADCTMLGGVLSPCDEAEWNAFGTYLDQEHPGAWDSPLCCWRTV
jgi:hypothetical protein